MKIDKKQIENLDYLFSSIPISLLIIQGNLKILYLNNYAEDYLSISSKNVIGKKLNDIISFEKNIIESIEKSLNLNFSFKEKNIKVDVFGKGENYINIFFSKMNDEEDLGMLLFENFSYGKHDQLHNIKKNNLSLSGFSSLMSHEIKTPLSSISGAVQLLETNTSESDKKFIKIIKEEIDRIVHLVDKMSLFDNDRSSYFKTLNIHDVLSSVLTAARVGFGKDIEFIESYDPSLPYIEGDKDSLVQLFTNLIKNSVEAIGKSGKIFVNTSFNSDVQFKNIESGSMKRSFLPIEISIKDKGVGVPSEILDQIFDPFITSKFDGSGLGLPMALKIASDHQGTINHRNKDGYTIFSVSLPVAKY
ncbi:MAG: hypothetical protein CMM18_02700 [Rhodospirillaceae bacterium]|nr:hypothetical protein [Rhodospirillaceae bacterium]